MKILVLNSGSSSIKYKLFDKDKLKDLSFGIIEKIGGKTGRLHHVDKISGKNISKELPIKGHREGFSLMSETLRESGAIRDISEIFAIGHRVVHGGKRFEAPVLIDNEVIATISKLAPLAPLHNPANLMGIEIAMKHAPDIPQVAVFDTAFHQTMQEKAFLYALPQKFYEKFHVRRYGFHGTSHCYVSRQAALFLGIQLEDLNCITLHLGNGASAAAIENGRSIDTSMGMTPLEGLIMGTRCGDIDPAIVFYLGRTSGMDLDEIDHVLNFESGLLGICGENDMRSIAKRAEKNDSSAQLAIDMFCHRLEKYIGAYLAILKRIDCLVFTGGIGENSALIRKQVCLDLKHMGIAMDIPKNQNIVNGINLISTPESAIKILVIPTNEELEIARQTKETVLRSH